MMVLGLYPSFSAFSSDMISTADAPSVRNDALAAVTVPCGLMNAGCKQRPRQRGVRNSRYETAVTSTGTSVW
jgi:hypothetical protein